MEGSNVSRTKRIATRASVVAALSITLLPLGCSRSGAESSKHSNENEGGRNSEKVPAKTGLCINDPRASPGYTLLLPMTSARTYLIDLNGHAVRTWECDCYPALSGYL